MSPSDSEDGSSTKPTSGLAPSGSDKSDNEEVKQKEDKEIEDSPTITIDEPEEKLDEDENIGFKSF